MHLKEEKEKAFKAIVNNIMRELASFHTSAINESSKSFNETISKLKSVSPSNYQEFESLIQSLESYQSSSPVAQGMEKLNSIENMLKNKQNPVGIVKPKSPAKGSQVPADNIVENIQVITSGLKGKLVEIQKCRDNI